MFRVTQTTKGFTLSVKDIDDFANSCGKGADNMHEIGTIEPFKGKWREHYRHRHPEERVTFPKPSDPDTWSLLRTLEEKVEQRLEFFRLTGLGGMLSKAAMMILLIRLRRYETIGSPPKYRTLRRKLEVDEGGNDQYFFSYDEIKDLCAICAAKP
jgi:hypothetical protein